MAQGCQEFLKECHVDLIIPVPLHPKRLRWRGFNQSLLLARQVSRLYEVPVDPFVLCREERRRRRLNWRKTSEGKTYGARSRHIREIIEREKRASGGRCLHFWRNSQ